MQGVWKHTFLIFCLTRLTGPARTRIMRENRVEERMLSERKRKNWRNRDKMRKRGTSMESEVVETEGGSRH